MRALARVDLGAIERNCARLAATAAPAQLCAVVKADGYGHGAVPAARADSTAPCPYPLALTTAHSCAGAAAAASRAQLRSMAARFTRASARTT